MEVKPGPWNFLGYQQIIGMVGSTALTVPPGARFALITTEAQNVRFREDTTAPTAAIGMLLKTTDPNLQFMGDLKAVRFIQVAATATLNVAYYQ